MKTITKFKRPEKISTLIARKHFGRARSLHKRAMRKMARTLAPGVRVNSLGWV